MSDSWLIVHTKSQMENRATMHLRRQGFRVWWWHRFHQRSIGRPQYRKTRCEMVSYFSRYLFVRHTRRIDLINKTDGVSTVLYGADVGLAGVGLLVVKGDALKSIAADIGVEEDGFVPDRPDPVAPRLLAGTAFMIGDESPFSRLWATVAETAPLDGKHKIRAYVKIFGRESLVEMAPEHIGEVV